MITIRATVDDGEKSVVSLGITGYGRVLFTLDKMPSHCGATILHDVTIVRNDKPILKLEDVGESITSWLLKEHKDRSRNFRRSRIIATDSREGWLYRLFNKDKRWQKSNGINNIQTNREIYVYWLDRNK